MSTSQQTSPHRTNKPGILLVGTGGSSGHTLAALEHEIRRLQPEARFTFIDTQPFNLRSGGFTAYPGHGTVKVLAPEMCGIRSFTGSQTANLVLNGGPLAFARIKRQAGMLLDADCDVLVICHDRMYAETAVLKMARSRGIATVLMQEGPFCAIGNARPQSRILRLKSALAPLVHQSRLLPPICDYGLFGHDRILAASQRYADTWCAAGVRADDISVVGVPRFDRLHRLHALSSRRDGREPVRILYLTQPFAAHGKVDAQVAVHLLEVLAQGLNLASATTPYTLTVRAHPRAGGAVCQDLAQILQQSPHIDVGGSTIEEAILAADVVIGHYSTGLLESLTLGRPVISLPVPPEAFAERSEADKQIWLQTCGIAICQNAHELARALEGLRTGDLLAGVRWDIVEEETGRIDGQATVRAAHAIAQIACDRSGRTQP